MPDRPDQGFTLVDVLAAAVLSLLLAPAAFVVGAALDDLIARQAGLDLQQVVAAGLSGAAFGLAAAGWAAVRPGRRVRRLAGTRRPGVADVLLGVAFGLVAMLLANVAIGVAVQALIGEVDPQLQPERVGMLLDTDLLWPWVVVLVVIAPLSEEVLFRGMLLPALIRRVGGRRWLGLVLHAPVFGLVHFGLGGDPLADWLNVLVTGVVGLVMGWLMIWRRSLLAPVLAHAAYNAINLSLMLLVPFD